MNERTTTIGNLRRTHTWVAECRARYYSERRWLMATLAPMTAEDRAGTFAMLSRGSWFAITLSYRREYHAALACLAKRITLPVMPSADEPQASELRTLTPAPRGWTAVSL